MTIGVFVLCGHQTRFILQSMSDTPLLKNRENGKAQDYDLSAANRHQLLKRKSGTFFVRLVSYLKSRLEFKWALKITAVFENMPIQANWKTS